MEFARASCAGNASPVVFTSRLLASVAFGVAPAHTVTAAYDLPACTCICDGEAATGAPAATSYTSTTAEPLLAESSSVWEKLATA